MTIVLRKEEPKKKKKKVTVFLKFVNRSCLFKAKSQFFFSDPKTNIFFLKEAKKIFSTRVSIKI